MPDAAREAMIPVGGRARPRSLSWNATRDAQDGRRGLNPDGDAARDHCFLCHPKAKPEDRKPGGGFDKDTESFKLLSDRSHTSDKLVVKITLPDETFVELFKNTMRAGESLGKKKVDLPHFTAPRGFGFKFLKLDDWKTYSPVAAAAAAPRIQAALAAL